MRTAWVLALIAACAWTPGSRTDPPSAPRRSESTRAGPVADARDAASGEVGLPGQGRPCEGGKCAPGLRCLRYFGVAGPRGPSFSSCEIPCLEARAVCPDGQTCVTVADGPGRVCRDER